jgi:MSHA pilin protein MshD
MFTERAPERNSPAQAGFSLVEVVISIVILGAGLAALIGSLVSTTQHSADPLVRKQTLAIADALLDEIELKPFANPAGGFVGAPTQANRALFDDVGDYNGFTTAGIFTVDGVAIPALANYNVTNVTVAGAALGAIGAANALQITVTVTGPGGEAISLSGYRTNYF